MEIFRFAVRTLLILLPFLCAGLRADEAPAPALHLRIPQDTDPERMILMYAPNSFRSPGKAGVFDYALDLPMRVTEGEKPLKLLLYCPGYQMFAGSALLAGTNAENPFAPPLKSLASLPIRIRLVDSTGRPLPGQVISVVYQLMEAFWFFDYSTGTVPKLQIAKVTTDAQGQASLLVPALLDDPFFKGHPFGAFGVEGPEADGEYLTSDDRPGVRDTRQPTALHPLEPAAIVPRQSYPEPITITFQRRGKISGHIAPAFFTRNGLDKDLLAARRLHLQLLAENSVIAGDNHGSVGLGCGLQLNGDFAVTLTPGQYDLTLVVSDDTYTPIKRISVKAHAVVSEGRTNQVDIP